MTEIPAGSLKAISLHQPWASLIAFGLKTIETRSWPTSYRGPLAIHAAKRKPVVPSEWPLDLIDRVQRVIGPWRDLPRGRVVAVCNLDECVLTRYIYDWRPDYREEIHFGDYLPGRFAWLLSNIKRIDSVPVRGRQSLWTWEHGPLRLGR